MFREREREKVWWLCWEDEDGDENEEGGQSHETRGMHVSVDDVWVFIELGKSSSCVDEL